MNVGPESIRAAREAVVWKHFESESAHEFETTLSTMASNPRYELIPTGQVFEGAEEVMTYYQNTRAAFPDQRHDNIRLHNTADAVVAEFDLLGTHHGELYGYAPTGKSFRCPVAAFFFFERDKIVCERVYFDLMTIMTQLGITPAPPEVAVPQTDTVRRDDHPLDASWPAPRPRMHS